MPQDSDTRAQTRIGRLAAYLPALRGPADTWIEITPLRGSGTVPDPYVMSSGVPRLTQAALEFVEMLYDAGWVLEDFDWVQWVETVEGRTLHSDVGAVAAATEPQIAMLLTALVRRDRFADGVVAEAFRTGLMAAIAARAAALGS
ncbi:MAG: hypothetical protein J0I19_16110 [Alphaproteobacteria bacterium]|nr:hypothetical protein [Alphaproteobacteria bacterium]